LDPKKTLQNSIYSKPALEIPPLVAEVSLSFMASFSTPVHKEN
jgi:hypothetical protein